MAQTGNASSKTVVQVINVGYDMQFSILEGIVGHHIDSTTLYHAISCTLDGHTVDELVALVLFPSQNGSKQALRRLELQCLAVKLCPKL